MLIATVAGRIAKVRSFEEDPFNGVVLKFTIFAKPLGWSSREPILCSMHGKGTKAIHEKLDDDVFVTLWGGIVPRAHKDGKPFLSMNVWKLELQGFAVEGEMAEANDV